MEAVTEGDDGHQTSSHRSTGQAEGGSQAAGSAQGRLAAASSQQGFIDLAIWRASRRVDRLQGELVQIRAAARPAAATTAAGAVATSLSPPRSPQLLLGDRCALVSPESRLRRRRARRRAAVDEGARFPLLCRMLHPLLRCLSKLRSFTRGTATLQTRTAGSNARRRCCATSRGARTRTR